MGQYHKLVNLDKREFVNPHQLGDGLKAWEQLASGPGGIGSAMILLTVCPTPRGGGDLPEGPFMGRWHGDRVLLVGDYAENEDFDFGEEAPSLVYSLCGVTPVVQGPHGEEVHTNFFTDITAEVRETLADSLDWLSYEDGDGWIARSERSTQPTTFDNT